jgi:hypothetical protein
MIQHYEGFKDDKRSYSYHKAPYEFYIQLQVNASNRVQVTKADLSRKAKTVAGGEGFEPSTPNLGGWCSVREKPESLSISLFASA